MKRVAVIAGAGPAGLTAAWELLARTDVHPVVIEPTSAIGGIARTHMHHGNRIDIGSHRFFSKSELCSLCRNSCLAGRCGQRCRSGFLFCRVTDNNVGFALFADAHHVVQREFDLVDLAQQEIAGFEAGKGGADGG